LLDKAFAGFACSAQNAFRDIVCALMQNNLNTTDGSTPLPLQYSRVELDLTKSVDANTSGHTKPPPLAFVMGAGPQMLP